MSPQMSWEVFSAARRALLAENPHLVDREVDLDEAVQYRKSRPKGTTHVEVYSKKRLEKIPAISTQGGRATLEDHIKLCNALEDVGCDILPMVVDSCTRHLEYDKAELGLKRSVAECQNLLNGFPIVSHGVRGVRQVLEHVCHPIHIKGSSYDNRLSVEIGLAGGATGFSGGAMECFGVSAGNMPLASSIKNYQYVYRLAGFYTEHGIPIVPSPGRYPLGGGGWPAYVDVVWHIIEVLLAAEQGVRYMAPAGGPQISIAQEIVTKRVEQKLMHEYLDRCGWGDSVIYTVTINWPGEHPMDESETWASIIADDVVAILSGADELRQAKTIHEGIGVPTIEASVSAIKAACYLVKIFKGQQYGNPVELQPEMEILEMEARSIIDAVLELGKGDIAKGAAKAAEIGVIDAPFSPNRQMQGKVIPARDLAGFVRVVDFGNVPVPAAVKKYHLAKLKERSKVEKRPVGIDMAIDDLMKGRLSEIRQTLCHTT